MSAMEHGAAAPSEQSDARSRVATQAFGSSRDDSRAKLFSLSITLALGLFLAAKAEFRSATSNQALYLYGVAVTSIVLLQMAIAFARYRDPVVRALSIRAGDGTALGVPCPCVACLVAVHNEELLIEQCVRSLLRQTYEYKQIVVVDDASTDGTLSVLRRLEEECGILVIAIPENVGKKAALAEGVLLVSAPILAFTDSDSVWAPEALERAVAVFVTDPAVGALSGHCRALNGDQNLITRIQDSWYEGQFSVRKAFESAFNSVTCVSGPFAAFRREAIFNFMPEWTQDQFLGQEFRFATDRTLTGFVLGARHVGASLIEKHHGSLFLEPLHPLKEWKVVYAKSVRAWTQVPETLPRLIRQQVRWKKSFLRNMFFTGRFYWQKPILAALVYYLHILFVLFGPLVAFRHLIYAPIHGNLESAMLYLFGILLIGSMFGLACWREESHSHRWVYRPMMSLLSTIVFSWLLFYAVMTIRRMTWARG